MAEIDHVNIVCLNCFVGYPPEYCELEKASGCLIEVVPNGTISFGGDNDESNGAKEYVDAVSTGRKRAARLYPISPGQVCAWAWNKDCGGGIEPIIGCTGRPASNIHHGPDKSTLNNDESNISVICTFCHNRWHAANDKYYALPRPEGELPWIPTKGIPEGTEVIPLSRKTKATKQEILLNEMMIPEGGKDKK